MDYKSSAEVNPSVSEGLQLHFRLCVASVLPPLKMAPFDTTGNRRIKFNKQVARRHSNRDKCS